MRNKHRNFSLKREERELPPEMLFGTLSNIYGADFAEEKMKDLGFKFEEGEGNDRNDVHDD